MPLTDNVGVAVLIGGKSSRMGSPKEQLITKDNQSFLMRICSEMDFFKYRYISHNSSQKYSYDGYRNVTDLIENIGPMGGIYSLLKTIESESVLVVACDMPFYGSEAAVEILEQYPGQDAVIPLCRGRREPLGGIYHRRIIPVIEELIAHGDYRLGMLIDRVDCLQFESKYQVQYENLNNADDYKRYLALSDRFEKRFQK